MTTGCPREPVCEMISPGNGAGNPAEPSVEELRASRRDALRRTEAAEAKAQEARIEAKAYSDAAEGLSKRGHEADAQARQYDVQGDPKKAAYARLTAAGIRDLADQNYRMADRKGSVAARFEGEAYKQRTLAAGLDAQIKKEMEK